MPRQRRCSSDGFRLFNMAIMTAPTPNKIKRLLHCFFHTEYDDRLEEMVDQCREASYQLYSYTQFKDIDIPKLIDNSIFNMINAILMKDEKLGTLFQIRRNYQYFLDVAKKAAETNDHNTAIMIRAALMHHAICQLKIKPRKKDKEIFEKFERMYGTFRNCYQEHLLRTMNSTDFQFYVPSLMVMHMHHKRHRAFSTIGRCKLRYDPADIEGRIGIFAMQFPHPGDKMPIYHQPPVGSSTDLILLAQHAK